MAINRVENIVRGIEDWMHAARVFAYGYQEVSKIIALQEVGDAPYPACLYPIKPFIEYLQRKEILDGR